jgi:nucleotide-binding universal stress UspA family protein
VPALTSPREFSGPIDTGWITALESQARRELDTFHSEELDLIHVRRAVVTGDPAERIVEFAHREKPDLIVMPTHGYGLFRRFLLGSVTAKVLHDVDCPVWTGAHIPESYGQKTFPTSWKWIGRVLCAIDPRTGAPALMWARDIAAEFGAELVVVHAVSEAEPKDPAVVGAAQATRCVQCLMRNLSVAGEILIEEGDPAKVVRAAATRRNADLVVIGRSPREGVSGRLRTNAYLIVRDSPCPVVSV